MVARMQLNAFMTHWHRGRLEVFNDSRVVQSDVLTGGCAVRATTSSLATHADFVVVFASCRQTLHNSLVAPDRRNATNTCCLMRT